MSIRVIVIQAEGEGVTVALQLIAGLNLHQTPAPSHDPATRLLTAENGQVRSGQVRSGTKRVPPRASPERRATGNRDEAILAALKFRPLRVVELADALHTDKRQIPKDLPRLYSVLKRLVRDKRVKKIGKTYAVK